jgi:hypothetical protein
MSDHANKNFLAAPVNWLRNNLLIVDTQSILGGQSNMFGADPIRKPLPSLPYLANKGDAFNNQASRKIDASRLFF